MDGADGEPMTKNRRHRTLRQQMLNKQAQQRYRCGLAFVCAVCLYLDTQTSHHNQYNRKGRKLKADRCLAQAVQRFREIATLNPAAVTPVPLFSPGSARSRRHQSWSTPWRR